MHKIVCCVGCPAETTIEHARHDWWHRPAANEWRCPPCEHETERAARKKAA